MPGLRGPAALPLLLLSIAVLTVGLDRARFWWQWRRERPRRRRLWRQLRGRGPEACRLALARWSRAMGFGEPLLEAASLLGPLLGLIGTVLALMRLLARLGPGLLLPSAEPLAGYSQVLGDTALGLLVGLLASLFLQGNRALRLGQLQRLQERLTPLPE
jgi:biopolymer transport protein ExbB